MDFLAVVPAAGSGTRMGLGYNKVFLELDGLPILHRTLAAILGVPGCRGLVVAAAPQDMEQCRSILGSVPEWEGLCILAEGGGTRQESVMNGLAALSAIMPPGSVDPLVLVHDAARPFVRDVELTRVLGEAEVHGAAILGVPAKDTMKLADADGFVETTLDRGRLWSIQTPQVFRMSILSRALSAAADAGVTHTDEASAVEALGVPVRIVMGCYSNIKVTTVEDIFAARGLLRSGDGTVAP